MTKSKNLIAKHHWSLADRFWFRAIKGDGCWAWRGSHDWRGYGCLGRGRGQSSLKAHRVSWTIHNGPIPEGMFICHRCDNPGCCRPDHLFLGTHKENMADMVRKGRSAPKHGTLCGLSKLTDDDVLAILDELADGRTKTDVAKKFGVTDVNIGHIARGRTWRHVTGL